MSWSRLWEATKAPSAYISNRAASDRQEVIAIMLPNSIDFVEAYLAVVRSGHIALPMDPTYKSLELDNIVDQLPPKLIITNDKYLNRFSQKHQEMAVLIKDIRNYEGSPAAAVKLPPDEQIVSLTFTSGTTGKPKAVPNTHSNHIWNI
ncbi:MAG TPA: class I adenylate-forming enzyme family protein, partial [Candidatus Saccharimonadales bacterium]|nr:class I adenylate-forming enzyme family protein [Candidatus Saccharimonadales bacterium]